MNNKLQIMQTLKINYNLKEFKRNYKGTHKKQQKSRQ